MGKYDSENEEETQIMGGQEDIFWGSYYPFESVLSAMPIYQLSFNKIPQETLSDIISLQCKLFFGRGVVCENKNRIAWLK